MQNGKWKMGRRKNRSPSLPFIINSNSTSRKLLLQNACGSLISPSYVSPHLPLHPLSSLPSSWLFLDWIYHIFLPAPCPHLVLTAHILTKGWMAESKYKPNQFTLCLRQHHIVPARKSQCTFDIWIPALPLWSHLLLWLDFLPFRPTLFLHIDQAPSYFRCLALHSHFVRKVQSWPYLPLK